MGVKYTISAPFKRFAELKGLLSGAPRWHAIDQGLSFFSAAVEAAVPDTILEFHRTNPYT